MQPDYHWIASSAVDHVVEYTVSTSCQMGKYLINYLNSGSPRICVFTDASLVPDCITVGASFVIMGTNIRILVAGCAKSECMLHSGG